MFIRWLTEHAVLLLSASVAITVGGETLRRRPPGGSATSMTAGLAYLAAKGVVRRCCILGVALAVYDHRLFDLDWTNPLVWLGIFVGRDFAYYWIHRAEHRVRILWASHMIHHSLERFTFTSAVRLPWMEALYKPVLALWVPLLGFHPVAFAAMGALVLMAGQLQHTELVRRRSALDLGLRDPVRPPGAPRVEPRIPRQELRLHAHRLGPAVRDLRGGDRPRPLRAHRR